MRPSDSIAQSIIGSRFTVHASRRLSATLTAWEMCLALLVVLAGCAADKPKPTPLESYTAQLAMRPAWNAKLDAVRFPLAVNVLAARRRIEWALGRTPASVGAELEELLHASE